MRKMIALALVAAFAAVSAPSFAKVVDNGQQQSAEKGGHFGKKK